MSRLPILQTEYTLLLEIPLPQIWFITLFTCRIYIKVDSTSQNKLTFTLLHRSFLLSHDAFLENYNFKQLHCFKFLFSLSLLLYRLQVLVSLNLLQEVNWIVENMNFTYIHLLMLSELLHLESFSILCSAMFNRRFWIYRSNSQISTEVNGLEGFDTIPFEESFAEVQTWAADQETICNGGKQREQRGLVRTIQFAFRRPQYFYIMYELYARRSSNLRGSNVSD